MRDPFKTLGLPRTADSDAVKRAYRQLVKKYHPDTAGGDAAALARFQEIADAYRLALAECRSRAAEETRIEPGPAEAARAYAGTDGPGTGASGEAKKGNTGKGSKETGPRGGVRDGAAGHADGPAGAHAGETGRRGSRSDFIETLKRAGTKPFRRRGDDIACTLTLPFLDAARGGPQRVRLPTGRMVDVRIPPGIEDGKQIRLRGLGEKGVAGGENGDVLITVEIEPHPYFSRDGDDIRLVLPVSIAEAVEGAKVQVPTIDGKVWMTVPAGSNTGTVLRLQGRGLARPDGGRGHQYVELVVVLPDSRDPDLAAFVRAWPAARSHDPRAAFGFD